MQKQDTGFLELIAAGNTIGAPEGDLLKCAGMSVPTAYRNELMRLVVVFADSELAGAAGFCPFINRGPGLRERIVAAKIVTEKYVHAELALALLKPFGVNPLLYVRSHAWDSRLDRHLDLGTRRIGGDKRLNVFHYPLEGWEDALVFNMLMGAATAIQLAEMEHCSYLPLAEAIGQILPREQEHAKLGESGVAQAIERGGNQAAVQAAVELLVSARHRHFWPGRFGSRDDLHSVWTAPAQQHGNAWRLESPIGRVAQAPRPGCCQLIRDPETRR